MSCDVMTPSAVAPPNAGCYRHGSGLHDDARSVRSDDGDHCTPRPSSHTTDHTQRGDSRCGLGDDSDAGNTSGNVDPEAGLRH